MTAPVQDRRQHTDHTPVLCAEAVAALAVQGGGCYVDGTFGGGGYTSAILEAAACRVIAIDRDPAAIRRGRRLRVAYGNRLTLIEGRFGDMDTLVLQTGIGRVNGVVLDLGVSSQQLDDPARGFSFRWDGPVDMRMGTDGPSAVDVVNTASEVDLANIIFRFGEERYARRVARAIILARSEAAIETTVRLAEIVHKALPRGRHKIGIDPATRTFQALRIHVNDELGELDRGLCAAERLLLPGGRLAVVAFHSLEDRLVKRFIRNRCGNDGGRSRHAPPDARDLAAPSFSAIHGRPIRPTTTETAINPRARSARLRTAERTAAPAWKREPAS